MVASTWLLLVILVGTAFGGTAGTTRYWDCNQPFCEPGNLPYPHSYRMFKMSDGRYFGHAAASDSILQGNAKCEHCYELSHNGARVVVKVDNWCPCNSNPSCCSDHFDIAVPGTDYGPSSASNVCVQHDPSMDYSTGHQRCSHWPWEVQYTCCYAVSSDPQLNEACLLFTHELNWDNPTVNYQEVGCPYEEMDAYDKFWSEEYPKKFANMTIGLGEYQDEFIKTYVKHRNGTLASRKRVEN